MAEAPAPLSELIKINDMNLSDVDGITDLLLEAPVINAMVADFSSNGTQHKYLKETKAPVVGFRVINDGRETDHSQDTMVSIDLQILDCSFHVDQAYADEYKRGRDAWIMREGSRHLRSGFAKAEQQLFYGTSADGDANGFDGIADVLNALDGPMVIGAGGTTALTSVYAIRTRDTDAMIITGNEGTISMGTTYQQMMAGATTGKFNAYVTPIYAYMGMQVGSVHSLARLANIDAGSNSLEDGDLANLLSLFPAGKGPDFFAMTRRSRYQLQASRTATNATGAPAPFPTEAFGVPIIVTDQISNDETVVPAS